MIASPSISIFHQWLHAQPQHTAPRSIILHCNDPRLSNAIITELADYLNEYDDDGNGGWLAATPELVTTLTRDDNHRQLLGLPEAIDPHHQSANHRAALASLTQRGHIVFRAPSPDRDATSPANAFHAGVGKPAEIRKNCHLILNSALLAQNCIAHIIGDVFLEWLHCDLRRGGAVHEFR